MWHTGSAVAAHGLNRFLAMWDPSSLSRDQTHIPCIGKQINPWATKDVPHAHFFKKGKLTAYWIPNVDVLRQLSQDDRVPF